MTSRGIATVLFTDIVGSTARLADLGDAGWGELLDRHRRMVRAQVEHFGGREVTTTGDGFLVVFDEPGPAIRCAVAIRDAARPLEIAVRTGIHVGEIENASDGDVGGIAVHLAARVMDAAEPGEILVTGTVRDLVQGSEFRFAKKGVRPLAGVPGRWPLFAVAAEGAFPAEAPRRAIPGPVLAIGLAALALVIVAGFLFLRGPAGPSVSEGEPIESVTVGGERSIAVLPLENLSPDPDDAYFAGAMTEEITSALSRVPGLQVVSRTSAQKVAGSDASLPQIASQLGVRYVIEGSVRRAGDQVAIVVQLIDAANDEHLWTERYERPMEDVLGLQVEVARRIADELRSTFTGQDRARILAGATDDPVAYDLYLQSADLSWLPQEIESKTELLTKAAERDPEFANAWRELGIAYRIAAISGDPAWLDSSRMALDRSVDFAKEPALEAYNRAFRAWLIGQDPETAIAMVREALAANPGNPDLVHWLARLLVLNGDLVAATQHALRSRDLDPLNASRWSQLGEIYRILALDDRAERVLLKALSLDRHDQQAWIELFQLRLVQGRFEDALAVQDSFTAVGNPYPIAGRAWVHLWEGDVEKARTLLERAFEEDPWNQVFNWVPELVHARLVTGDSTGVEDLILRCEETVDQLPMDHNNSWMLLQLTAIRGDGQTASDRLRRYVDLGGRDARKVARDPTLARVRSDPRFQAEVEKLEEVAERDRRRVERVLDEADRSPR